MDVRFPPKHWEERRSKWKHEGTWEIACRETNDTQGAHVTVLVVCKETVDKIKSDQTEGTTEKKTHDGGRKVCRHLQSRRRLLTFYSVG